jgi:hypothetical protein
MSRFMEWLHGMTNPEPLEIPGQLPSTFAEALAVHVPPVTPELKQPSLDLSQLYETMQAKQDLAIANGMRQRSAEVNIPTELPVTVFMVGDIHHGSIFTNEQMWRSHKEQIEQTPGAYIALMHNLIDNAQPTTFPNNMLNNTIVPEMQFESMKQQVQELNDEGKIVVAVSGSCHEGWLWRNSGIDADKLLYDVVERNFPILQNGGILHLTVGNETYDVGLFHEQGPFNSNFNPEHSLRQNRRLQDRRTDVEVGAHHHVSSVTMDWEGNPATGQPVAFVRAGTYKGVWPEGGGIDDAFVVDRRGITGEPPGNSVTFYPDEHRMVANMGFENGIDQTNQVRLGEAIQKEGFWQQVLGLVNGKG